MSEQQLSLPGFETSPELDFLFFALLPAEKDAPRIGRLGLRLLLEVGLTERPIATERLHVSLHTVGAWHGLSQAAVRTAKDVGASFARPPFEIVFDRAMSFARNGAFVLRAGANITLASFHRELGSEMKKAGIGRWVIPRFTPHLTLSYGRMVTERPIEPVRWTVRDFVLVQSLRGRGKSKHIHLARWPLRA